MTPPVDSFASQRLKADRPSKPDHAIEGFSRPTLPGRCAPETIPAALSRTARAAGFCDKFIARILFPGVMAWNGVNGCLGETDRRIHPARAAGG